MNVAGAGDKAIPGRIGWWRLWTSVKYEEPIEEYAMEIWLDIVLR